MLDIKVTQKLMFCVSFGVPQLFFLSRAGVSQKSDPRKAVSRVSRWGLACLAVGSRKNPDPRKTVSRVSRWGLACLAVGSRASRGVSRGRVRCLVWGSGFLALCVWVARIARSFFRGGGFACRVWRCCAPRLASSRAGLVYLAAFVLVPRTWVSGFTY